MWIVKFKNGNYGVRRSSLGFRGGVFLDRQDGDYWWSGRRTYRKYFEILSLAEAQKLMDRGFKKKEKYHPDFGERVEEKS